MRHRVAHRKLGRVTEHRIAMLRNQATALIRYEHIETTVPKAKELRPFVERLITIAKRGVAAGDGNGRLLHARRLVGRELVDGEVVDQAVRHDRAAVRRAARAATRASCGSAIAAATAPRSRSSSSSAASTIRRPSRSTAKSAAAEAESRRRRPSARRGRSPSRQELGGCRSRQQESRAHGSDQGPSAPSARRLRRPARARSGLGIGDYGLGSGRVTRARQSLIPSPTSLFCSDSQHNSASEPGTGRAVVSPRGATYRYRGQQGGGESRRPALRRRRRARAVAHRVAAKTFAYRDAKGRPVRDARTLDRIRSLVIPPAWTDVWICARADGHLQATGRDARGRKQHRYHPDWTTARNDVEIRPDDRVRARAACDPQARAGRSQEPRRCRATHVLATVVMLLEKTLIRIGNKEYARANNSFGLTTLLDQHVQIKGASVTFHFRAKSGVMQTIEVDDAPLARIVKRCRAAAGRDAVSVSRRGRQAAVRRFGCRERVPSRDHGAAVHGEELQNLGGDGARREGRLRFAGVHV